MKVKRSDLVRGNFYTTSQRQFLLTDLYWLRHIFRQVQVYVIEINFLLPPSSTDMGIDEEKGR